MSRLGKFYIVGNWKMNPEKVSEAKSLFSVFEKVAKKVRKVSVIVCPPAVFIESLSSGKKRKVSFGIQDIHTASGGSHTGGVSATQAKSVGVSYVIIGHSERRAEGDTNEIVAQKIMSALDSGLKVILCIGEKSRDEHGIFLSDLREQIISAIKTVPKKYISDILVAYEPSWAIGKKYDEAPSPQDIHEMIIFIKKTVSEITTRENAMSLSVLYGGSVDFDNAQAILKDGEVSGLLIGRQSLDSENFKNIILYANSL